jgi:hypothetical protein
MIYRTVGPFGSDGRPNNMYFSICMSTGDLFYPWSTNNPQGKVFSHWRTFGFTESAPLEERGTQPRGCRYLDSSSPAIFELRHSFLLPSLPLRSRCLRTRFAAQMRLSCRRNLKQVFSQSASAGDAQKRSYFSPVRCRQEVLFALWECCNSDSETSERRGIMLDFMASDGPDRLDLRVLGVYG